MNAAELSSAVLSIDGTITARDKMDRPAVTVPSELLLKVMRTLRDDPRFSFDMLCTHTAIDWPQTEKESGKIELIYQLYSTHHRHYLAVSVSVPRNEPLVSSVSSIWQIAEWQEREVFDLFGVLYSGHPDLRRLFLEDDWVGYPLRKDYKDDFMLERPW